MKVYKGSLINKKVIEIEAERINEKSVWINGRRSNRFTDYDKYCETKEDAAAFIRINLERKVKQAESRLAYEKQQLEQFLASLLSECGDEGDGA